MFKQGDRVTSVLNASKLGTIRETGLCNSSGVQWVEVLFDDNRHRWMLADALRENWDLRPIPVPDGVVVMQRGIQCPEVFQQPESPATSEEVQAFADAIYRMWLSKKAA